jgi:hypothetical protein
VNLPGLDSNPQARNLPRNQIFPGPFPGERLSFAFDSNGNPSSYQSSRDRIPRKLEQLNSDTYRSRGDEGRLAEFRRNPVTGDIQPNIPSIRSRIPSIEAPSDLNLPFMLDREFRTQDIDTSLANLNAAFSSHGRLTNSTFRHNFEESLTVRGQDLLFGRFIKFASGGSKPAKFFLDAAGLTDKIKQGYLPGRQLTNWGRQQITGVFDKFLSFVDQTKYRISSYTHTAERFKPSLLGGLVDAGFKNAPFYGDLIKILNIKGPKPGDFIHTVRFVTQDFSGFFRQGELSFTYGPFTDGIGRNHRGVVQVSFTLRLGRFRDRRIFESTFDENHNAPWL